jgi:hypothetical protein
MNFDWRRKARAQELRGTEQSAWSDLRWKAKSWQAEGEAYVRDNPIKAALIALGLRRLLGCYAATTA